ncbi:cellulase family glycosylhydrolase [Bacteroidota bacterium]
MKRNYRKRIRKSGRIINYVFRLLLIIVVITGCVPDRKKTAIHPTSITVNGDRFIDNLGRHVILNGLNVVSKKKEEQYIFQSGPEFYTNLKSWGVNCIRFIIIWDGLEPEPGVYDEEYLKEIDKRIQWAGDNGLFVILDMHQDLFSVKYSDGAPEWATLDEGKQHVTGSVWSDAYLLSSAVQTSFDNFWANKPAPDGIGVQDHYASLWKYVAERYANNPTVIGYDIMNEPFPGSPALQSISALLKAYGELVYSLTGNVMTKEELINAFGNPETKAYALDLLSTEENFSYVVDALFEFNHTFESTTLMQMYQKVSNAIRKVDNNSILFIEHGYFSNIGVRSSIERPKLANGNPDPLVAFAPHGFDLVTDTKDVASAQSERVALIYGRAKEKGSELNMPVWLGEWGAYYNHSDGIVPVARYSVSLIEEHLFGQTYWSYFPGTENLEYFQKALLRPYPSNTNGELLNYHYDHDTLKLLVEWKESKEIDSPTLIYVPWMSRLNKEKLRKSIMATFEQIENSDAGWVIIPKNGENSLRKVAIQFKE